MSLPFLQLRLIIVIIIIVIVGIITTIIIIIIIIVIVIIIISIITIIIIIIVVFGVRFSFFDMHLFIWQINARQDFLPRQTLKKYLTINPSSSLSSLVPRGMSEDELTAQLTLKFKAVSASVIFVYSRGLTQWQ